MAEEFRFYKRIIMTNKILKILINALKVFKKKENTNEIKVKVWEPGMDPYEFFNMNPIYTDYNLLRFRNKYSIDECKSLIDKYNLDGLEIFADLSDDKLDTLDFLSDFQFVKKLRLCTIFDYNYDFLTKLVNLEGLSLDIPFAKVVDLTNLHNLKHLDVTIDKLKITGLEQLFNLEFIGLFSFREKNFDRIKNLINLNQIKVKTASIKNLEGIENLQKLDEILLANCRSLRDISQLTNLQNIKKVFFDSCTKIKDFDILAEIPSIEEIAFVNCKDIKSIKFFDKLPNLQKFVLTANSYIVDNDLNPAVRLPLLRCNPRKTYNIELVNTHFNSFY
jgi:hypothetical protein